MYVLCAMCLSYMLATHPSCIVSHTYYSTHYSLAITPMCSTLAYVQRWVPRAGRHSL